MDIEQKHMKSAAANITNATFCFMVNLFGFLEKIINFTHFLEDILSGVPSHFEWSDFESSPDNLDQFIDEDYIDYYRIY